MTDTVDVNVTLRKKGTDDGSDGGGDETPIDVEVQVQDETHSNLSGATVELTPSDGSDPRVKKTAIMSGIALFTAIPAVEYGITVTMTDYTAVSGTVVPNDETVEIGP